MRPFPFTSLFAAPSSLPMSQFALTSDDSAHMTRFLRDLVQTPSVSTREGEAAALIRRELEAVGARDVSSDSAGNIIVRLGDGLGPTLLIDAHMDTVSPTDADWVHAPYAAAVENGILYGLGACDSKGSIAAAVYAAKRLIESEIPLHGTLALAFVVQQEPCEGCALKRLLQDSGLQPDWVLLAEPSDLTIKRGHRGRVLFKITVRGRSSHSSRPDLGENAITAAARLIFGLDLLAAQLPTDPFLGAGTIAVTHIESRAAGQNAIPDACTFYVDRRLTLGETAGRAQSQIESIIEREGIPAALEVVEYEADSYTGYSFRAREAFNAWALEQDHPLINALSHAAQSVIGKSPAIGQWSFSTDGVFSMAEACIPTIGFGPGDPDAAHCVDEQVRLEDVASAAQVYAVLAAMMLSKSW
jgi:putative selenium metabolism hydrolase